ncbi:BlaI/MecI/CopY family transcriptional regulator [Streptomyces broussonetiae]|uniref:BlaI/MecI/CopY family transcriptional regulator n=1 Tax=Streptomyces broussonetiae TaxID=2686304 RepID=A0A6I6NAC9_9ACTN|nr:BlaI/MecI/CopY family transcriptional regulator [Streptomyces broussonetiae]QHA05296.1 BlaI/MecI/CopY family transcriptional regulator [Streptomyces broussonetiae]
MADGADNRTGARRRARGELEGEVLAALWAAGGSVTAVVVHEGLGGDTAYTTVLTILMRLCDKGLVTRRREGRSYLYTPVDDRPGMAAAGMHSLLDEGGDRAAVLARFVSDLSAEDERLLGRLLHGDGPRQG